MHRILLLILILCFIAPLFCCDAGFYTAKVELNLINGTVVKGLLLAPGDFEGNPFRVNGNLPDHKRKDGNDLLSSYKTIYADTREYPIMIAQQFVSLPWGFFYISDKVRNIPIDSVQSIIYQSEKEPLFNGQRMYWHSISAEDNAKIQGIIYGVYFGEDPMEYHVYINTNEHLSKKELELYALRYFTGDVYIQNPEPTLVSKFSGSYEIKHKFLLEHQKKGIQKSYNYMLEYTSEYLESYKKPLEDNELYTDSSKTELLNRIDIAQKDIKLLRSFIEKHLGKRDSDLPLDVYPERLRELAKSYDSFEVSNSLFLSIFAVVDRPNILKDFEFEWKKNVDDKALFKKLGIVVLETMNPMGGFE